MTLSLALKSLKAKPLRTVASVLAVAVAVAMFFCMFSFESAVYRYVFEVETADFGDSDIMITAKSGGDRIALVQPLYDVEGVESVTPTVSVYALTAFGDEEDKEYLRLRGFDEGGIAGLEGLEIIAGDLELRSDDVVISKATAERFSLRVGDLLPVRGMTSGGKQVNFYVGAIAENRGPFSADSPYTVLGSASRVSSLIITGTVYNEIYVTAEEGADLSELRERIAAMPEYASLTVSECLDEEYIATRARNIASPVTIAGAAVALLAVVAVALVFTAGVRDRRAYAAKLALVGATKKRIAALFATESAVTALLGAVLGSLLAVGVFALMIAVVLSSVTAFAVDALLLFAAAVTGAVTAFAASLYPLVKVFRSTARENLVGSVGRRRAGVVTASALAAVTLVLLLVENLVPGAKGALSAVDLVLVIACAAAAAPVLVRALGRSLSRTNSPSLMVAGMSAARERKASSASQILAVGMTVSMLLFTAWSLTTSVFSGFTAEFERMILVTNVSAETDTSAFTSVDGVNSAHLMVWRQATLSADGIDARSVNVLGSADALGLVDFEYLTSRADAERALAEGKVVLDRSMSELYGVRAGDTVRLDVDGTVREFEVGALVRHNLFNGGYVIVSAEALKEAYDLSPDTVVLTADGDVETVAEEVRSRFADRNYYAVPALAAYEWDTKSLENIFDLIAALAFMLTALAFAVALAGAAAGRSYAGRTRSTLLCAGLSKRGLLGAETVEQTLSAVCAFVFALPASALAALCLVNALSLFGLYFGFMYNVGAALAAGLAVLAAYALVPVVFGFKRGYGMRRE